MNPLLQRAPASSRIRSVTVHRLEARLTRAFAYSQAWYSSRSACLVEITTEDGVVGWGEAFGPALIAAATIEWFTPLVVGCDALATEAVWQRLYNALRDHGQKGGAIEALSAIDIALWDLRGQLAGLPIHRLLGGPLRSEVQAYATGLYRRAEGRHETYLRAEAAGYVDEGFGAVKLKTGWGLAEDVALTTALRDEIGSAGLMVDANHAYDARTAIQYAQRVADLDLLWFEEPVTPEDVDGYVEVRRAATMPIAGGEAEFTRWGHRALLVRRAVDIVQPDVAAAGGISECKKIADMASAFGIRCNPHVWGTQVSLAAALQLLAVLPDTPPSLNPLPPLLEFDRSEHPLRDVVVCNPITHRHGTVAVPTGPGLGLQIDRDALRHFRLS
jgi:D-galactarolactone cycloisomerase